MILLQQTIAQTQELASPWPVIAFILIGALIAGFTPSKMQKKP